MIYDAFKSFVDDHAQSVKIIFIYHLNLDYCEFRLPILFILFMKNSYEMEKVHA